MITGLISSVIVRKPPRATDVYAAVDSARKRFPAKRPARYLVERGVWRLLTPEFWVAVGVADGSEVDVFPDGGRGPEMADRLEAGLAAGEYVAVFGSAAAVLAFPGAGPGGAAGYVTEIAGWGAVE